MTRGNHTEGRYDHIQGRPLMPRTEMHLDSSFATRHKAASRFAIITAAGVPCERPGNPITRILFLTKKQYMECVTEGMPLCRDDSSIIALEWILFTVTNHIFI